MTKKTTWITKKKHKRNGRWVWHEQKNLEKIFLLIPHLPPVFVKTAFLFLIPSGPRLFVGGGAIKSGWWPGP